MLIAAAPTSPLVRSPMERRNCNRRIKVFSGLAKPAITPSVFLQNSLRNLAGNFRAEFDPEQGIRIPEQGIWRLGNPNPVETLWGAC